MSMQPSKSTQRIGCAAILLVLALLAIVFYCHKHNPCCKHPAALAFSTVDTSGIDGINNGVLTFQSAKPTPITLGLFCADGTTLADPKDTLIYCIEILDSRGNPHPGILVSGATTGTFEISNPVVDLSLTLTLLGAVNQESFFIRCRIKNDSSVEGRSKEGLAKSSSIPTSTVHVTVLGIITACEDDDCLPSAENTTGWPLEPHTSNLSTILYYDDNCASSAPGTVSFTFIEDVPAGTPHLGTQFVANMSYPNEYDIFLETKHRFVHHQGDGISSIDSAIQFVSICAR